MGERDGEPDGERNGERDPDRDDVRSARVRWLLAGQELLRRGGIVAVKLQALADETGLTTGSFYHHFEAMSEYVDELARFYGAEQVRDHLGTVDDPDPRRRLTLLAAMAGDRRMVPLDAAMRDWAGSNALAAAAVKAADAQLLEFLVRAFEELGYSLAEARVRARLLLASGVARVVPPWGVRADEAAAVLRVVAPET